MIGLKRRTLLAGIAGATTLASASRAAEGIELMPPGAGPAQPFPLHQVRLNPSIFLQSVETNKRTLLALDPDRFLHNFRRFAGLEPKGELYGGWEAMGIAGHSLGHYQSALSLIYVQTGDERFRNRSLYISRELAAVQQAHGDGYAGAATVDRDGKTISAKVIYDEIRQGDIRASGFGLNDCWVPLYTYHKLLAGALDSHFHCQDAMALDVAKGLAGFLGDLVDGLSDDQVQDILQSEHGGINESYAELYARTGDQRWLRIADRLRHRAVLDPLAAQHDELNGKHANTQIPKLIGLARIYEVAPTPQHRHDCAGAAMFFWDTVTQNHSYVIGGNSDHEHFGEPRKLSGRLGQETCEACNSYNMLKLTRHLYGWTGDARYFDFYERTHLNHIMSQQHPETGMFSYFTPLASGFGRVRSTLDDSFWCCVGSGMESNSKHGDSIWWRRGERVLVNLFYPSTLDWTEKGVRLEMETGFPMQETIRLRVAKAREGVDLGMRIPGWASAPKIKVNGDARRAKIVDRYLMLDGLAAEDVIELTLPMALHHEVMPDNDRIQAYLYGPLVLAAEMGTADEPRNMAFDPVIVAANAGGALRQIDDGPAFALSGFSRPQDLVLKPFFNRHDMRTAVYFRRFTPEEWPMAEAQYLAEAREQAEARARTIDIIRLGEMQPERDHAFSGTPNTMPYANIAERGRNVAKGFFEFKLATRPGPVELRVVYSGNARNRDFAILVNGQRLTRERLSGEPTVQHNVISYPIPAGLLAGDTMTVRFEADSDQWVTVYECRTLGTEQVET
ncbi:beta-L-arabinofuranosidase domain-containing protein [Altererythrobacter sp.]|uniref:beta-L-arabinofuranosidase domain-containing protein n=1 Tax=Altererythrobacter sp. TaxID=1872480 RepID=UPI003D0EF9CA